MGSKVVHTAEAEAKRRERRLNNRATPYDGYTLLMLARGNMRTSMALDGQHTSVEDEGVSFVSAALNIMATTDREVTQVRNLFRLFDTSISQVTQVALLTQYVGEQWWLAEVNDQQLQWERLYRQIMYLNALAVAVLRTIDDTQGNKRICLNLGQIDRVRHYTRNLATYHAMKRVIGQCAVKLRKVIKSELGQGR